MQLQFVFLSLIICLNACTAQENSIIRPSSRLQAPKSESLEINQDGQTLSERFSPPEGFIRLEVKENSFEQYLQNFPLHPIEYPVHYYNGSIKSISKIKPKFCSWSISRSS